jgi:hypothetical protein
MISVTLSYVTLKWKYIYCISLLKRPKIICSPSYVDIRSRANTTRELDFEHMIKARAQGRGEDR